MPRFHLFLRCVGEAVVAQGARCLLGALPFGERLYDIACDAHDRFRRECRDEEALAQVEAMAQASLDEVRQEAREVLDEVRAGAAPEVASDLDRPEVRSRLAGYLEQVPAAVRASLRRPADPGGRSIPPGFTLTRTEDFLRLLPARPPRFQPDDRPVGSWLLEELLGIGGFGEVWKARHTHLRNLPPVALKFCLDESSAGYLRHEAGLIDRMMEHSKLPGVVELRNAYLDADPPCLEYEYVPGGDLCGLLRDWTGLELAKRGPRSTRLIARLTAILTPLHRASPAIVHRDLKPANILLVGGTEADPLVKIADFGIGGVSARQALEQASRGVSRGDLLSQALRGSHTPLYASPEQALGGEPDPRDDVHALGVLWYQLLVGDLRRGVAVDLDEELRDLGVPEETVSLVRGCVARAERRWADAGVLAERLRQPQTVAKSEEKPVSAPTSQQGKREQPRPAARQKQPAAAGEKLPSEQVCLQRLREAIPGSWGVQSGGPWTGQSLRPEQLEAMRYLRGLPRMQTLDLDFCKDVTDACLEHLVGLKALQTLKLHGTSVTDAGLAHLRDLTALQHLSLRSTSVTDAGLAHLRDLTALQRLDLSATKVTDAGLAHLRDLTALRSLHLAFARVTDAGLAQLRHLTELTGLYIGYSRQVSDAGLAHLRGLSKLQGLDLSGTRVTSAGLASLRGLTALKVLDLEATVVGDSGLAHVCQLTGLEILDLTNTNITEAGLARLHALTRLTELRLIEVSMTKQGLFHWLRLTPLARLRRALPRCTIITDWVKP